MPSADVRARTHLRRMAARITRRCTVVDRAQAVDELMLGLSVPAPLPGTPAANCWIRDVDLQTSAGDIAQASEYMAAQRHEHLRGFRVRHQAENLRAMLADPGLAHAWFLNSGRDHLNRDAFEVLAKACGAVAESGVLPDAGPSTHDRLAHTVSLLLSRMTTLERQVLLSQLPSFLKFFGQKDLAGGEEEGVLESDAGSAWLNG